MRPSLNLSPKHPTEPILFSHTFKSNSKCCNFCTPFPNSIKLFGKFVLSLLVCVIKFSDQSKLYWFFGSSSKFTSTIWVHQIAFDDCNFSFIQCLFLVEFVGLHSPWSLIIVVKFSCQSNLFWMFGSNLKFKIPTFLDYNELWWLITSSYKVCFQKKLLEL